MTEKYDSALLKKIRECFSFIDLLPCSAGIVDLEENMLVYANNLLEDLLEIKNGCFEMNMFTSYDFKNFIKELDVRKNNTVFTNTNMVDLVSSTGKPISSNINIKLLNKVKPNLGAIVFTGNIENETPKETDAAELFMNRSSDFNLLFYIYNPQNKKILYMNDYTKEMLDTADEKSLKQFLSNYPENSENGSSIEKNLNGQYFRAIKSHIVLSGCSNAIAVAGIDITDLKKSENQLLTNAVRDSLTGKCNSEVSMSYLSSCIESCKSENLGFSLCYVNLNNFEEIIRESGESAGDEFLEIFIETSRQLIRRSDIIMRITECGYIIMLISCPYMTAERIMKSIGTGVEETSIDRFCSHVYSITYSITESNDPFRLDTAALLKETAGRLNGIKNNSLKKFI